MLNMNRIILNYYQYKQNGTHFTVELQNKVM